MRNGLSFSIDIISDDETRRDEMSRNIKREGPILLLQMLAIESSSRVTWWQHYHLHQIEYWLSNLYQTDHSQVDCRASFVCVEHSKQTMLFFSVFFSVPLETRNNHLFVLLASFVSSRHLLGIVQIFVHFSDWLLMTFCRLCCFRSTSAN